MTQIVFDNGEAQALLCADMYRLDLVQEQAITPLRRRYPIWAAGLVRRAASLFVLVTLTACQLSAAPPFTIAVSVSKIGDAVTTAAEDDLLILTVASETGIGAGRVTVLSEALPAAVEIRLQLQGLEELRFSYAQRTVVVSVQSYGEPVVRQTVQEGDAAPVEIGPDSPYWIDTTVLDAGLVAPAAHFAVQAPPDYINTRQRSFELHWVDFYR